MEAKEILKHYIGTGLKIEYQGSDALFKRIYGMEELASIKIDNSNLGVVEIMLASHEFKMFDSKKFKPIFNPLSSLTKEIVVEGYNGGKPFVPALHLAQLAKYKGYYDKYDFDLGDIFYTIVQHPYGKVLKVKYFDDWVVVMSLSDADRNKWYLNKQLISWHFCPWQSELEEGSWVDITTLTKAV